MGDLSLHSSPEVFELFEVPLTKWLLFLFLNNSGVLSFCNMFAPLWNLEKNKFVDALDGLVTTLF